eukprot:COSAG02_NODE_33502_length_499_cov_0.647500_1_plen_73_part_10
MECDLTKGVQYCALCGPRTCRDSPINHFTVRSSIIRLARPLVSRAQCKLVEGATTWQRTLSPAPTHAQHVQAP